MLGAVPPGAEPALHARMIEALEAVGGDASVLAHHAAAAADVPRILRYAPAAASDAARSGAHREAVAFYELALRHLGQDDPGRRAGVLELLSEELYLTDRLDGAIAARTQALELRRGLGDVVAVGAGHRALSLFTWYAADRWTAQRQDDAAISVLSEAGEPRRSATLANRAYLAAGRGDAAKGLQAGREAQRIADELGTSPWHRRASIGGAGPAARRPRARSDLLAARDAGLRLRLDEFVTVPMSNLAHHDVEHGRFAQAATSSPTRCASARNATSDLQHVAARSGPAAAAPGPVAGSRAGRPRVLAAGDIPLGRLWSHLVLGLLAARRARGEPHLDELWRLATSSTCPACSPRPPRRWPSRRGSCAAPTPGSTHRSWRYWSTFPPPAATSSAGGCAGSALPVCSRSTPRHPPSRQTSCSSPTSGR